MITYSASHTIRIYLAMGLLLLGSTFNLYGRADHHRVIDLQCEHLINPLGLDEHHPRLSWRMESDAKGAAQSAYKLMVATDSLKLVSNDELLWDSGKRQSPQQLVVYDGPELQPFTKYYWKVIVWDEGGEPSSPSGVSHFETGMMGIANWQGTWISDGATMHELPAGYFRKSFDLGKQIASARVYIAAAGLYELHLNGRRVGDHRLDPMYTRFDRRNLYVTYDVTALLQQGDNALGVILGNGWYNHQPLAVWNFDRAPWRARPSFCLDLRITYSDGSTETIRSDGSWRTNTGPVIRNNIYTAEHYDSRITIGDWDMPGFIDTTWKGVALRAAPSNHIVSQQLHPIRNVREIVAQSIRKVNDSVYVFDMGQNMAGVTKVTLNGESGTIVRLKHGERLYPNGRVDLSNIDVYYRPKDDSEPFQTDIVILNGEGPVEFMPRFNYKGFRYVEVSSDKAIQLKQEDLVAYFMHSDVPAKGSLNSSNTMINKLWEATNNAYLSNLFGYPTDCPQREKNGWTGDGHFAIETALYNFDGITVYEKWLADHRDEQQPNGVLPDIIPTGGWGYGTANGTDWTSTIVIIPWNLYLFYGDLKPLQDNYDNMKRYVNYVERLSPQGLTTFGRGDWVPVKSRSSLEYTSSVYYFVDATILAKVAKLLNREEDRLYYQALAAKIRQAINDKYLDSTSVSYGSGVQTELSMALYWHVVPDELRTKLAENLARRVQQDGMHLDVGVLGAKAILNALSENGQAETAYKLAVQDTYPSWGWWIANGATTLQENWDMEAERDISDNHMMFGEIGGWFFKGLGGIYPDESAPGFKNIILKPNFVSGLNDFSCSLNSPYGKIISSWQRKGKKIYYSVTIPPNASASLSIPMQRHKRVYLDGDLVQPAIQLSAGSYEFRVE
ncbi:alpha-L-rhamnosidase [Olivibacter sp. XZL3]|uniref:alpha-L-rhamnosidase n=1 Tax=Olivibacter sp. XZL3 TaxID=1735116 RepID=UPI001F0D1680|nr:alpha-L-rhamnosidase [Olivibacter sp. XZL3]